MLKTASTTNTTLDTVVVMGPAHTTTIGPPNNNQKCEGFAKKEQNEMTTTSYHMYPDSGTVISIFMNFERSWNEMKEATHMMPMTVEENVNGSSVTHNGMNKAGTIGNNHAAKVTQMLFRNRKYMAYNTS
jgi:hypothetical protein